MTACAKKHIYDGKFSGNILVLGRTDCGKTSFVQKLALYDFFGELKAAKWVSGIQLSESREAQIESNFSCSISFYYPNDVNDLIDLIDEFKLEVESEETDNENVISVFGENINRDRLIVFDDVSGLADKSNKFASFLTVARKYRYNCVYIFHTIYPENAIWKTILSQTNIFNIFPASVSLSSVRRILDNSSVRKSSRYIPRTHFWLNRLFIELANKSEKVCLTLDQTNTNRDGPSKYRSDADNPDKQVCYYNNAIDEQVYNEFIAKRIKSNKFENEIQFEITNVKSKTDKNVFFALSDKIEKLVSHNGTKRSRASEINNSRTREILAGRKTSGNILDGNFVSIRENDERAKPKYLLER